MAIRQREVKVYLTKRITIPFKFFAFSTEKDSVSTSILGRAKPLIYSIFSS